MAAINVSDLTAGEGSPTGTGVFDELMRATEAHIQHEYSKGRIKGTDYATVYLGAMQAVMDRSLQFLLQQQRTDLEAQLMQEQIATEQINQRIREQELLNLQAQESQTKAQTANLEAEALNIPKQGELLDAQTAVQTQQEINLTAEKLGIEAQTAQTEQQTANAIIEGQVLTAQKCKLDAEFDLLQEQKLKTVAETALLGQKKVTEKAQTDGAGIGPDSVVGKQNALYDAQRDGYRRDAEQKAAKLLVDSWNVRKTMDDTTPVDDINKLGDSYIGASIQKLLDGINATV